MRIGGLGLGRRVTHAAALAKILGLSLSHTHLLEWRPAAFSLAISNSRAALPMNGAPSRRLRPTSATIRINYATSNTMRWDGCLEFYSFAQLASERARRDGSPPNQFAPRAHQAKEFGRYIVFSSSSFDTARIKIIICAHTNSLCALRERHTPPTRAAFPARAHY